MSQSFKTTRFGTIVPNPADAVTLPAGVIGFPELKRYTVLPFEGSKQLHWLQSLDDGSVAFLVCPFHHIDPDYVIEASETEVRELGDIEAESDVRVLFILTVGLTKTTANMKAPLVINSRTGMGKQVISSNPNHYVRFPVARARFDMEAPSAP